MLKQVMARLGSSLNLILDLIRLSCVPLAWLDSRRIGAAVTFYVKTFPLFIHAFKEVLFPP
jgi:hypothetical protein